MLSSISVKILFFSFLSNLLISQHIWYNDDGPGDLMLNDVYVDSSASTTYYETLGWNQGGVAGGYTGMKSLL